MGSTPSAEFKGDQAKPDEILKLTLESEVHRDELKEILLSNKDLKQKAADIVGSEDKLESVFEEKESSYKTLLEYIENDPDKVNQLAQLLLEHQKK